MIGPRTKCLARAALLSRHCSSPGFQPVVYQQQSPRPQYSEALPEQAFLVGNLGENPAGVSGLTRILLSGVTGINYCRSVWWAPCHRAVSDPSLCGMPWTTIELPHVGIRRVDPDWSLCSCHNSIGRGGAGTGA
jgi:hypothetical protein